MGCLKKTLQVFKNGVCISESLGKCKGCENGFFNDLEKKGFSGLKINENGIKPFGEKNILKISPSEPTTDDKKAEPSNNTPPKDEVLK